MKNQASLEHSIAAWMADEAAGSHDDALFNDILAATGRAKPQPRWLALLKEPPMRLHSRVAVGSPTARLVFMTTIPLLLLLASVAVALAVQPSGETDDWPIFLGDYDRSGVAEQGPVGLPVVKWRFQAGGSANRNVAIVGDFVYASSDDGLLHALSRADGTERWTYPAAGSDVSVANGLVVTADDAGAIHALDAVSGTQRWLSDPLPTPTGATYGDDTFYVGTGAGELVALDKTTGDVRWRTAISDTQVHNAAFRDGRVFVGTNGVYVALSSDDGSVLWTIDTGSDGTGSARLGDGLAFLGASCDATSSHLRAIDIESGAEAWSTEGIIGAPALGDGVGYSGGQGHLTAFDQRSGTQGWQATFDGCVAGPVLADGVLYVPADGEHRTYALDAATGRELWRVDLDGGVAGIAVAGGVVYSATAAGSIWAIGGDGSTLSPGPIPSAEPPVVEPSPAPDRSPATAALLASQVWSATAPDPDFVSAGMARDPDGTLWVADVAGSRFALFSPDGEFVGYWAPDGATKLRLRRPNGDPFGDLAFAPDGSFYVLSVGDKTVLHFDSHRNLVGQWGGFGDGPGQYQDPIGIAVGPDGTVYVLDDVRSVVESYSPDGSVLGAFEVTDEPGFGLAVDADGNLYLQLANPTEVRRLDRDGTVTGTFGAPGSGPGSFAGGRNNPNGAAISSDGRVFVIQVRWAERAESPGVMVYAPDGRYLGGWASLGRDEGELGFPWSIELDDEGNAYVTEYGGDPEIPSDSRIQKFRVALEP